MFKFGQGTEGGNFNHRPTLRISRMPFSPMQRLDEIGYFEMGTRIMIMKRLGIHRPTIEDAVEISGIEMLHPGGLALTRRTAELAKLRPGKTVLDVSSGRGTQSMLYAAEYGVDVTGIDLSPAMVRTATESAVSRGLEDRLRFKIADSQRLPFGEATFDVVINECAVGIPDDSQQVLNEMVRVARPGGAVVIHESIWRGPWTSEDKAVFAERYGTTPLEVREWIDMLHAAGARSIEAEIDAWSQPEMFWKIRQDRDVGGPLGVLTPSERAVTVARLWRGFGIKGILKALVNESVFYRAVRGGRLGYGLFKGVKPERAA
jgi:SAM-dependent methyltransferase